MKIFYKSLVLLVSLVLMFPLHAADADAPFGKEKYVLQISDGSKDKQTLILNVAANLKKNYGEDNVVIEIVAFGPGLKLLFADNNNEDRIFGLAEKNVRFSACAATIKKIEVKSGAEPELHIKSEVVPGGVIRLAELVRQGYVLIRP